MKRMTIGGLALCVARLSVILADGLPTSDGLLVYEGFDHPNGTLLHEQAGGTTYSDFGFGTNLWSVSAGTTNYTKVVTPGFSRTNLLSYGGQSQCRGTSTRRLAQPLGGAGAGRLWLGFSIYCSNSSRIGEFRLLSEEATMLFVKDNPNGTNMIGFDGVQSDVLAATRAYFMLVCMDFGPENVDLTLWIDPDLGAGEPDPLTANATKTEPVWSFDGIALYHSSTSYHESRFDEIRIGKTFASAIAGVRPTAAKRGTVISVR